MHRLAPALVVAVLAVSVLAAPRLTQGSQPLPTPRGRLGGPVPLQTPPLPAAATAAATPTLPAATPVTVEGTPSVASPRATDQASPVAPGAALPAEEVATRLRPAVVTVVAKALDEANGTPEAGVVTTGSGFFLDGLGHIVTAAHVIEDAEGVDVVLADGERRTATVVGADHLTDVAVLRVEGPVPAAGSLSAAAPRPGETVLAFTAGSDELPFTVTRGIIGGVGRPLPAGPPATDLIQHDAVIFPAAGGGPLVSLTGEVIGINVAAIPTADGAGPPDVIDLPDIPGVDIDLPDPAAPEPAPSVLAFAVPAAAIGRVASALIAEGRVVYPYFGAAVTPVTAELAVELDLPSATGALVEEVTPDGPADRAGIRPGDVIVAFGGEAITAERSFGSLLFAREPGETVAVTLRRGDAEVRADVTLGERPRE